MQKILQMREGLIERLKSCEEAGDAETAAALEYGIAEFDGVIALLTCISRGGHALH